jgi:pimeloyl-ACP methyl ester carboxylesterase
MSRSFYSYAIFFTALHIIASFSQSILFFQLSGRVTEMHSFKGWLTSSVLITVMWLLIMLKYYHYKQYRFPFRILIVYILAMLIQFILLYSLLVTREVSDYYIAATLALLGADILYAISLIFSGAGKRPWLKAAGVYLFILNFGMVLSFIWALNSISVRSNGTMEKVEQWASLFSSLSPILFMMNFYNERATAKRVGTSHQRTLNATIGAAAMLTLVSFLFFGPKLIFESIELSRNPHTVGEYAETLAQPFEARTYVNNQGDTMRYRLMIPQDFDSTKQYPLIVCLHGSSGCGTDNVKQVAASLPAHLLASDENRTKYPGFLFVPQCPPYTTWGGIPNVAAVDSLVFETIRVLEMEFSIDKNRRYVAGNSLGGYGTWHFICTRPEMFAAAIPISGGGNPDLAQNIITVPVWAFHGAKDRNVPVSGSRDIIRAMQNMGGNTRYTEYPDAAHNIWYQVSNTPGLLDWLFAQRRDEQNEK